MKKKISLISISVMTFLINFSIVNAENSFSGGIKPACGFDYMPERLPNFTSGLYNIVKLLVPIILIVMGMIDFTKAVMASDEKKMKDAQKSFITRLIASVIIFLIMAVVQFVFGQISKADNGNINKNGFVNCIDCLLNNNDTSCGAGSTDLRKTCSSYEGKNCPPNDDYGNACTTYSNGSNNGGCRKKGTSCIDFSSNECNGSKTLNGVSCQLINGVCSNKYNCNTYSASSCSKETDGYCKWNGSNCVENS